MIRKFLLAAIAFSFSCAVSAQVPNQSGMGVPNSPPVSLANLTNSIGADVSMNVTANYFDGPTIAQGTTGTFLAVGQATVSDTAGAAAILCKLWDGTTVIDSAAVNTNAATNLGVIPLSGVLANPAGNIRISCRDLTSTSGLIKFNASTNSKDSTVSVVRIQ